MDKSLHTTLAKTYTRGGNPLFHSSDEGVTVKKMFPVQSIFHRPEQIEVSRRQIRTIWWVFMDNTAGPDRLAFCGLYVPV
jgi:hypothetical protein